MPVSSASSAERRADWTIASIITSRESAGTGSAALASMSVVSSAWSSEPQLTPMRTGLSFSSATRMIVTKFSSCRLAPTLPGLMRYLASVARHLRVLDQQLVAVVVEVADDRDANAQVVELAPDLRHGARGAIVVDRDAHELGACVGERGNLQGRGVGVGRVRVRHRLDDDRVARADQHAADVDRRRLPATGQVRFALDCPARRAPLDRRAASAEPLYVEERDPDEQRHQQR